MSRHRARRSLERLRPRSLGQALVETALAAPFLVMLLVGGAQVGSIAYDQVSLDSAAREGARAGAAAPTHAVYSFANGSQWYTPGNSATYTYKCQAADFATGANPICLGVLNATGFLTQSLFTSSPCASGQACVTITVVPPANLASAQLSPSGLRLVSAPQGAPNASSSPCAASYQAEVDGTVVGIPSGMSGTLSDSTSDPKPTVSSSSPNYQYCVRADNNVSTQTITAQIGPAGCGGYTGSVTITNIQHAHTYTGNNITLTAEPACTTATTATTSSSATTTSSATSTTATTTTSTSVTGPTTGCASHPVDDSYYFTVSVTYPAPIFVPFINNLFQTSAGVRTITASVTYPVEPCTMTGNGTS